VQVAPCVYPVVSNCAAVLTFAGLDSGFQRKSNRIESRNCKFAITVNWNIKVDDWLAAKYHYSSYKAMPTLLIEMNISMVLVK